MSDTFVAEKAGRAPTAENRTVQTATQQGSPSQEAARQMASREASTDAARRCA